jgi:putative ABC transport system substrate-binding protein
VGQTRLAAFLKALEELGWTDGLNVRIETRWGAGELQQFRRYAVELVALAPDVILATSGATVPPLLEATRSVPIVFAQAPDPVRAGFVQSLARPGGNATGFTNIESSIVGKWLELLQEIAPRTTRAAVLRDATDPLGSGQFAAIQALAPSLGVELSPIELQSAGEIERAVAAFGRAKGGMIVLSSVPATVHRDLIIALARQYRLPAVYPNRFHVAGGGLISYGPDTIDPYRRAAEYVSRILKGERPGDLPVQAPTRFELVINMKSAKSLDLEIPATLLSRADEVIE